MEAEGGIVFYIDETGERGLLVVSPETLTEYLDDYFDWGVMEKMLMGRSVRNRIWLSEYN